MKKTLILLSFTLFIFACSESDISKQATVDAEVIASYIADNNLNAMSTSSGLHYVIEDAGSGAQPTSASTVKVKYKGFLIDGSVFDESTSGLEISLNSVIPGWREGIPLYKEGGKGTLIIPSGLGYGAQNVGTIPANSVLLFDIELVEVK